MGYSENELTYFKSQFLSVGGPIFTPLRDVFAMTSFTLSTFKEDRSEFAAHRCQKS